MAARRRPAGAVSLRSIAAEDLPATGVTPGSYTNGNFSVGADGRLTAASNGSAGGVSWTDSFFSPVTLAQTQLSGGLGGGSYTAGVLFYLTRAATIGKIRFLWPTSAAATIRVRIWTGGSSVAAATVAVNAAGAYEGTVNYAVGSADLYRSFYATTFIVGVSNYISYNPGGSIVLANSPPLGGPSLVYSHLGFFAIGDAQPTNSTGGELFPVEPILQ
jgi:hypothetical protein